MVWYHSATILTERRVKRKRKKEVKGREDATWMRSATERNAHELQALGHRVLKREKEKKKKIIVCF